MSSTLPLKHLAEHKKYFYKLPAFSKVGLSILVLVACFFIPKDEVKAQVCTGSTPIITINLLGHPDSVWTSVPTSRENGTCCGNNGRCINFHIIPDPNIAAITFDQITGPDPGSYDLTINCGTTQQTVAAQICLRTDTVNDLVFCKPGNNIYQYQLTGIPKPIPLNDDSIRVGCSRTITKIGLAPSSIVWNSIAPGVSGAYNSYLSCVSACTTPLFTPTSVPPGGFIDYVVTGTPLASGCLGNITFFDTVRMYVYPQLTISVSPSPASFCPSSSGVTLTSTQGGGLGPYSYSWTPVGATTANYFATSAGTYTVTLSDALSSKCPKASTSVPVSVITLSSTPAHTDVSCNGGANGSATVTATGGTPPYTYSWSTGLTATSFSASSSITGLTVGTYGVLVTAGCTSSTTYTVTQPTALNATIDSSFNVTCNGNSNGRVFITPSGGTAPYTYAWNSGQTTQDITGIGPGTFTVTVTDAHGCIRTATQIVTQPSAVGPLPGTAVTPVNLTCHGNFSGSFAINTGILGGTPPYAYLWSNGATTPSISGLAAGCLGLHITDGNGCTADTTVCLTEPDTIVTAPVDFSTYLGGYNIKCHGGSDGSVGIQANGGTAPYFYTWSNGATSATISNVPAGTYTVTVKDINNCTVVSNTIVLTQPDSLVADLTGKIYTGGYNIACKGEASGYAFTDVTGGVASYSYSWTTPSGLPNDSDLIKLYAGFYQVQITDANGCTAIDTITMTEPDTLVPLIQKVFFSNDLNISCFGVCDGKMWVASVLGGTPSFTISWDGNPGDTLDNACAGEYLLHIVDSNGCVLDTVGTLTGPPPFLITAFDSTNIICHGGNNGFISPVSVVGGSPGYTYSWAPGGQTTLSISGLTAGSYTITIADTNACNRSYTIELTQPDTLDAIMSSSNVRCKSVPTGTAGVTVSGGTGAYTYLWSPGTATTSSISNLAAGTYCVHITDENGCFSDKCFTITEPTKLVIDSIVPDVYPGGWNISCNGGADGNVRSFVSGGTLGYTYFWNYNYTTQNLTGVSLVTAPPYILTVTDSLGCTAVDSVLMTEPPKVVTSAASVTPVFCFGDSTGQISMSTVGGTGPYKYYLGSLGNPRSNPITGLTLGTYLIYSVDSNGCTDSTLITITSPPGGLNANVTSKIVSCAGINTGVISVVAGGGTPGYTYSWNTTPVQTTATATGLPAGTYTVMVTDTLGCSFPISGITLNQTTLAASVTNTVVSCSNINSGTATVTPSGGTLPYTYAWSSSPVQTSATAIGLSPGSYSIVVMDSLGCTDTLSASIGTNTLNASITNTVVSCSNINSGTATITPTGGTLPYTYAWSSSPVQTSATAIGLSPGSYSVVVMDSLGCTDTLSASIGTNTLNASITNTVVSCSNINSGTATITPTGGTLPYTYAWSTSPVQTSATATSLSPGSYSIVLIDSLGCTDTLSASIGTNTLNASITNTVVSCSNINSGTATVTPSGGTLPYTYAWSSSPVQTSATAIGLSPGSYSVVVIDSLGCTDTLSASIGTNTLNANITNTVVSCSNINSGTATVTPTGGTFPYTYAWSTSPVQTSATAIGLSPGSYSVVVMDSLGCTDTLSASIGTNTLNANITNTVVSCSNINSGTATVTPTGGTFPYTYAWSTSPVQTSATAIGLSPGSYSVVVMDSLGCTDTLSASIGTNTLNASITNTVVSCSNINSGTATVTPSGGTLPYTYAWSTSPVQTSATAIGLSPGSYTVVVMDSLGCTDTLQTSIGTNTLTVTSTISDPISCDNANTGTATANATGGTQPYTYLWSNTQTTATATGLGPGTYSVIVIDSLGCTDTIPSIIIGQNFLSVNAIPSQLSCKNINTGIAVVVPSGGTQPYTYLWSDNKNQTTQVATGLAPGNYFVVVIDSIGCRDTVQTVLIAVDSLTATLAPPTPSCTYINNGIATVIPTNGTMPYTYLWSDQQTTQTATGLAPGITYTVIVTDSIGCTDTIPTAFIDSNVVAAATAGPGDTICVQDFTGEYQLHALDPNPASGSWQILHGTGSLSSITDLNAYYQNVPKDTAYHIIQWIVVNGNCSDTAAISLVVSHTGRCLDLELPNGFSPNSDGSNDSYIIVGIERYPVNTFKVFNRWGNEVFSRDNYTNHNSSRNWEGQNNKGEALPGGTYYVVLVTDNGNITRNTYVDLRR